MKLTPHLIIVLLTALFSQASLALEGVNTKIVKPEGMELNIKPEQMARIKAISADLDVQIKNAFKGEEALQKEMQAELDKINKITDLNTKRTTITAYQNKYQSRYQAVLAKGKINLADVATKLNSAVPEMEFMLSPNMTFQGKLKKISAVKFSSPAPTAKATTQSTKPQPAPTQATVKNLVSSDYYIDKKPDCDGITGNEIAVSGGYMTNKAHAIGLGGCENLGEYIYPFTVLPNQKVVFEATYDMAVYVLASTLGGSSYASSHIQLTTAGGIQYVHLEDYPASRGVNFISKSVFSLAYWPVYDEREQLGGVLKATITTPGVYEFIAGTYTKPIAIDGGSYAESRIKKLRVTLTTSPNR